MPYLPKTSISIESTSGNFLVYKDTRENYIGEYIRTNKEKFYAGTDNVRLGKELILLSLINKESPKQGDGSVDVKKHKIIRKKIYNFLSKTKDVPSFKPNPTKEDYKKGLIVRYFAKRINANIYIEIEKEVYNKIRTKSSKYDYNLYQVEKINWHIIGNVQKKNSIVLNKIRNEYPNIVLLFPQLDEYHQYNMSNIQNNLLTSGGELYFADGKEYIGPYHIHPSSGPMVGAEHKSVKHDKLYYLNQLPNNIGEKVYQEFVNTVTTRICYQCEFIDKRMGTGSVIAQKVKGGCPPGWGTDPNPCQKGIMQDPVRDPQEEPNPNIPPSSRKIVTTTRALAPGSRNTNRTTQTPTISTSVATQSPSPSAPAAPSSGGGGY